MTARMVLSTCTIITLMFSPVLIYQVTIIMFHISKELLTNIYMMFILIRIVILDLLSVCVCELSFPILAHQNWHKKWVLYHPLAN